MPKLGPLQCGAMAAVAGLATLGVLAPNVAANATATAKAAKTAEAGKAAQPSGQLTVYAALTTAGGQGFASAFEQKYPDVHVTMVTGGTGSLETQIETQAKSGDVQPDVVFFADPSSMATLNQEHILSSWRPPSVRKADVPEGYLGNGWVGAITFENVIVYHSGLANPPTSWHSLLSSSLYGKVVIGDPGYSGTTFGLLDELDHLYGWRYYENLKDNDPRIEESTTTTGTDVAKGLDEAGVTLDSVARSLLAEHAPIVVVWPHDGAIPVPGPVGITTTTKNPTAAKAFVTWLMSRPGQQEAAKLGYDPALLASRAKPSFAPIPPGTKQLVIDWQAAGKAKGQLLTQFKQLFGI